MICVNLYVGRSGATARKRLFRTLAQLVWIANDLGLPTAVCGDRTVDELADCHHLLQGIPRVQLPDVTDGDVFLCTTRTTTPTRGRIIAWKESEIFTKDATICQRVDLLVGRTFVRADKTKPEGRPSNAPLGKCLSVPFPIHQRAIDAMTEEEEIAYLRDDLSFLRTSLGNKGCLVYEVGFWGYSVPGRRQVIQSYEEAFRYTCCQVRHKAGLSARGHLGFLSACEAVPNLPGDFRKCYRMAEIWMMGTRLIQAGPISVTPPLTTANTILLDDWTDTETIANRLDDDTIVPAADKAYKEGWSLRAQLKMALQRVGCEV